MSAAVWAMRALLVCALLYVVGAYSTACRARPCVVHEHFELDARRRAVVERLRRAGARLCCPHGDCEHAATALGAHARGLRVTSRRRTPHCGDGEALLLADGRRVPLPLPLRTLEQLRQ